MALEQKIQDALAALYALRSEFGSDIRAFTGADGGSDRSSDRTFFDYFEDVDEIIQKLGGLPYKSVKKSDTPTEHVKHQTCVDLETLVASPADTDQVCWIEYLGHEWAVYWSDTPEGDGALSIFIYCGHPNYRDEGEFCTDIDRLEFDNDQEKARHIHAMIRCEHARCLAED